MLTLSKVAVGSTSAQKLKYVEIVLKELEIKAKLYSYDVESQVATQPMSVEETQLGAFNRAQGALQIALDAEQAHALLGLGIEVGYYQDSEKKYLMFCSVCILEQNGVAHYGQTPGFLLPDFFQEQLEQGWQLGDYTNHFHNLSTAQHHKWIAENIKSRRLMITQALENGFYHYLLSRCT